MIFTVENLVEWRSSFGIGTLVVTNGCFDILHAGHVAYLHAARAQGDALLVGLNDDASVRALKGAGRPINCVTDRAHVLAALRSVDSVCIFHGLRATEFLRAAQPDVYVKGADYTLETLDLDERLALEEHKTRIVFVPMVEGLSTTAIATRCTSVSNQLPRRGLAGPALRPTAATTG